MVITLREKNGVPFYACDGFSGAAHGFSTRAGGVSPPPWDSLNLGAGRGDPGENVAENYRRFCAAVGADPDALVKNCQVHSTRIRPVTRADILSAPDEPGIAEADALVTDESGVCLTIFSGDCVPVLLYDPKRRVAAAAHAGWRGSAGDVAGEAVRVMEEDYGCDPADVLAAIGPGIAPCCFETHIDVPEALRRALGADAEDYIRPLAAEGKFSVDLKGVNARWLRRAGVRREHIAVCPACTACDPDRFWSHRRMGSRRGSMAAVIQLEG